MEERKKNLCAMIPESLHKKVAGRTGRMGNQAERVYGTDSKRPL